jgi:hypothetical protein
MMRLLLLCVHILSLGANGRPPAHASGPSHPKKMALATEMSDWRRSPVIVGGTGGSGTRGVVQLLMEMGIYMVSAS